MEYSPKLLKQRSCSCPPPFDIQNWCSGRRRPGQFARRFGEEEYYDEEEEYALTTASASRETKGWRGVWKRIVNGKRRVLYSGAPAQGPYYDEYTYAQNFDEGSAWVEPENLSRSFSARFAVPARSKMARRLD